MPRDNIYYRAGYRYQLADDYTVMTGIKGWKIVHKFFELDETGLLTIKAGYAWDGATKAIDTLSFMRGSLVHDVFCQAIKAGLLPWSYKENVDRELYKICLQDGMNRFRAKYVLYFVLKYSCKDVEAHKIESAPDKEAVHKDTIGMA